MGPLTLVAGNCCAVAANPLEPLPAFAVAFSVLFAGFALASAFNGVERGLRLIFASFACACAALDAALGPPPSLIAAGAVLVAGIASLMPARIS